MSRFIFFLFSILPLQIYSQGNSPLITGSIKGIVIDSVSREVIEYAVVSVFEAKSNKIVNGGITDDKGIFLIRDLPVGFYRAQITFIGYATKNLSGIELTAQHLVFDAGRLLLSPETELLEEVRVVGETALIEAKPDKIVYNAERDITSSGGDASDVLRKVPLLTVDLDGNVSMRGSNNVKILINGRPSSIFNNDVAEALRMMPADQIKSIEVITSPSAKYDGEGTAGIINIITKRKNVDGVAGSVEATVGTRSNRGNANFNLGKGKFGFNLSGGGHYGTPQTGESEFIREEIISGSSSLLTQNGTARTSRIGYRINSGIEYNLSPQSTFNGSFSLRGYDSKNLNDVTSSYTINDALVDSYHRVVDGKNHRSGWDAEASYRLRFPKKDKEWSFAAEVDHDDHNSTFEYDQQYSYPLETTPLVENNLNTSDNLEITLQTDYTHPINENVKLETGLKSTWREIVSDFDFNTFSTDQNQWVPTPERSDIFYYDQNVYAGYGSASFLIGKTISLISGVRLEVTDLQGRFEDFDNPFKNDYLSVLPNITIAKKTGELNQVKASYNQRIQRPNQRHINPFIEYNDNRDISYGNPLLFPELVHQVELSTNLFFEGNMINISVFGRQTEDLIENLLIINDDGVSESTYYNFGERSSLGLNLFGSLNLGESLSLRGGVDVNAWKVKGDFEGQTLSNDGFDYNGRLNVTWAVTEHLRVEGFSFFRSPYYTVQGKNPSWSMVSFGLKQELFKKRVTLGINVTQPFTENQNFTRELEGPGFYQYSNTSRPSRSFGITLGYRFGKLDFKERTGRNKVNNNDLKDDEPASDSFQGGGN